MQPTGDFQNVLKIKLPLCVTQESVDYVADSLERVLTIGWSHLRPTQFLGRRAARRKEDVAGSPRLHGEEVGLGGHRWEGLGPPWTLC